MKLAEFQGLPVASAAQLVRASGPKVCVFPINGTRRWYLLEHEVPDAADRLSSYLAVIAQRHIDIYRLLFDHGLDTLLTPAFGPDLMDRGEEYVAMAVEGLAWLARHPAFLQFYADYDVRVRFYGDYRKHLSGTEHAHLVELFDEVMDRTKSNTLHRLFFGLFAHDATETIAELAVRYHAEHGVIPTKDTLIALYYGEPVGKVDLFIGFDKPCVFDMPLVATGSEDLYFTVSPSLYLGELQLREILYDHLYARCQDEVDYLAGEGEERSAMEQFYRLNLDRTIGVGARHTRAHFWYPLPQVVLPSAFECEAVEAQPGKPAR